MSQSSQQSSSEQKMTNSSQGFEIVSVNKDTHQNLNLFFPTNGLNVLTQDQNEKKEEEEENNEKSVQSSSSSSDEIESSDSSMEVDNEEDHSYAPHLAIIIPNYFDHQHQTFQQLQSVTHFASALANNSNKRSRSSSSSNSSSDGDSVILLKSRGVQTDPCHLVATEQQEQEQDDEDEFFDTDQNQNHFNPFKQI